MTALLSRLRAAILALLLVATSFAGVPAVPLQEIAAASVCTVNSRVQYAATTTGFLYVWARGDSWCPQVQQQVMNVQLYVNGRLIRQADNSSGWATTLSTNTGSIWAYCGVRYQALVTHSVIAYSRTETYRYWSAPYAFRCR